MLHAAGISTDGPLGPLRVLGLGSVYGSVFSTWLEDGDPGLARTMAALDRRLKRGERTMTALSDMCAGASRLIECLKPCSEKMQTRSSTTQSTEQDADGSRNMGYGRA
jgi:hypothetical protein